MFGRSDVSENAEERPRHRLEPERVDEKLRVPALPPCSAAHEAPQLVLDRTAVPGGLLLQRAERPEVAVRLQDGLDGVRSERADELVLEIGDADVDPIRLQPGALERSAERLLLPGVAETRDGDARAHEVVEDAADRLRAADGDDRHAFGRQVAALPARKRLEGDPVARALDEDDRAH